MIKKTSILIIGTVFLGVMASATAIIETGLKDRNNYYYVERVMQSAEVKWEAQKLGPEKVSAASDTPPVCKSQADPAVESRIVNAGESVWSVVYEHIARDAKKDPAKYNLAANDTEGEIFDDLVAGKTMAALKANLFIGADGSEIRPVGGKTALVFYPSGSIKIVGDYYVVNPR